MHFTTPQFWECYHALPESVRQTADHCYALLKQNPSHPSLHFKKVDKHWSVRVGVGYRALGVEVEQGVLWYWIGSHADYDTMLKNM